jgi:hypothetical protein
VVVVVGVAMVGVAMEGTAEVIAEERVTALVVVEIMGAAVGTNLGYGVAVSTTITVEAATIRTPAVTGVGETVGTDGG